MREREIGAFVLPSPHTHTVLKESMVPSKRLSKGAAFKTNLAHELAERGESVVTTVARVPERVRLKVESPASAKLLNRIPLEGVIDLEDLLFGMFEDGDDDALMLLSATVVASDTLVGFIFWRDVPPDEMHSWLTADHPTEAPHHGGAVGDAGWVKIELLGTDRSFRGHGIGKILLGAVLAYEQRERGMTHAVLQVAGGEDNIAANRLYDSFGFELPPQGYFTPQESKNLQVVWSLPENSLRSLTQNQPYPNCLKARGRWRKVGAGVFATSAAIRHKRTRMPACIRDADVRPLRPSWWFAAIIGIGCGVLSGVGVAFRHSGRSFAKSTCASILGVTLISAALAVRISRASMVSDAHSSKAK